MMTRAPKISIIVISVMLDTTFCYAANSSPQTGTITPSSGSSYPNQVTSIITTHPDPDGYMDIGQAKVLINTSITGKAK